jgi:putative hydrolase of HD superfamily
MTPDDLDAGTDAGTAAFLMEAGHLKRTKRAGWWIAGIRDPESVAEHSYRVAVIGYVLAVMEGANPDRTAALCVFHDVPETRIGDIPSVGRPFIRTEPAVDIATAQTAGMPAEIAERIVGLVAEFEGKATPEARCAKDADRIECLLQGLEYVATGNPMAQPWVDTMAAAVKTESGKRLVEAALSTPVDEWWREIVSSYGKPPSAG